MEKKLEVDIQVIVHATEDLEKIFFAFKDVCNIDKEDFSIQNLQGHYNNPITLLHCKIKKKKSQNFVKSLISSISKHELDVILEDLENRCDDSSLYLRISKQALIEGKIVFDEDNPIKLKIYTPIYTQKDIIKVYSDILTNTI